MPHRRRANLARNIAIAALTGAAASVLCAALSPAAERWAGLRGRESDYLRGPDYREHQHTVGLLHQRWQLHSPGDEVRVRWSDLFYDGVEPPTPPPPPPPPKLPPPKWVIDTVSPALVIELTRPGSRGFIRTIETIAGGWPLPALRCAQWFGGYWPAGVTPSKLTVVDIRGVVGGWSLREGDDPLVVPWLPIWSGLIVNAIVWAAGCTGLTLACSWLRGTWRRRRGFCGECGYSRAGLQSGAACPECGSAIAPPPAH